MTKQTQHTGGPWAVDEVADNKIIVVGGTVTICFVGYDLAGENNRVQADAALIAAAPSMYEALQDILADVSQAQAMRTPAEWDFRCEQIREKARNAIGAEGQQ